MSERIYPIEFKLKVLKMCEEGHSVNELASMYNVDNSTIMSWKYKFEKYGIDGLNKAPEPKKYSKELKLAAIQDYQSGCYSIREVVRKYEISNPSVLMKWLKYYNEHRDIKATAKGMSHSMVKGRTTTWEERKAIVLYCLSHNKDYHSTAEIYKVSYQQVYQWVRKYEDVGVEALRDRRGRKKEEVELSPEEKIKFEMKKLEKENERLRAENAFLKKLEELERRRK